MQTRTNAFRRGAAVLAACAALAFAGCSTVDKLLAADNPAAIDETQLNDATLVNIMVNSVIGALTNYYADDLIWRGEMFTDEEITGINWEQTARLNLRIVQYNEGDADIMFRDVSRYRFLADSIPGRFRTLLSDPSKDRRMALILAHAGYSYTLMAETMCEATINVGAKIYSPKELAQLAIPRFEEAITIANAVGSTATDVANLARAGLARAALLAGDKAKVMSAAQQVPANFVWWVEYKDQIVNDPLAGDVTGANHNIGVSPKFLNGTFGTQNLVATQTDPRIQHTTSWSFGHNALTKLYKPYQSLPYSGYNAQTQATGGKPILYANDTDIKLASYLEAMHDYYEAAGPSGTGPLGTTLDFVNSRRAYGNQTAVNLSGRDLMLELHEQRARDTYLGGNRLGDLRRWMTQTAAEGGGDFFPTGIHPNPEWGPYGTATCFPLPSTEYVGNPNIKRTS